jgi:membrane-bound serine protease (ClpP class)
MLIDSPYSFMRVSVEIIIPIVIATSLVTLFLVGAVVKAHRKKSLVGREGLIGEIALAETEIDPRGQVSVHGEIWKARSNQHIRKGERLKIVDLDHLELIVEKTE